MGAIRIPDAHFAIAGRLQRAKKTGVATVTRNWGHSRMSDAVTWHWGLHQSVRYSYMTLGAQQNQHLTLVAQHSVSTWHWGHSTPSGPDTGCTAQRQYLTLGAQHSVRGSHLTLDAQHSVWWSYLTLGAQYSVRCGLVPGGNIIII